MYQESMFFHDYNFSLRNVTQGPGIVSTVVVYFESVCIPVTTFLCMPCGTLRVWHACLSLESSYLVCALSLAPCSAALPRCILLVSGLLVWFPHKIKLNSGSVLFVCSRWATDGTGLCFVLCCSHLEAYVVMITSQARDQLWHFGPKQRAFRFACYKRANQYQVESTL